MPRKGAVAKREATKWRGRAAKRGACAVDRFGRDLTIPRHDRLFLDIPHAHHRRPALAGVPHGEVGALARAIALVEPTDVDIGFGAVEFLAQDDVDYTCNRIRAVKHRGAVF